MSIPTPTLPELDGAAAARWRDGLVAEVARRRRTRARVAALSGSAVLASGATALAFVLASPGVSYAFGGWTATPSPQSPATSFASNDACVGSPATIGNDGPPTASVVDARGPFTLGYYVTSASGYAALTCVTGPAFAHPAVAMSRGVRTPAPAPGQVDAQLTIPPSVDGGQSYSIETGAVGAGVTGVTFELSDGSAVVATVGDGLLVAWWPGTATVTSTQVASG